MIHDRTIEIFGGAINKSAVDRSEKVAAFKRLARFAEPAATPPSALAPPG